MTKQRGRLYWWCYRKLMKLAHRHDWHHAPMIGPILPGGDYQRWCKWCGFRAVVKRGNAEYLGHSHYETPENLQKAQP